MLTNFWLRCAFKCTLKTKIIHCPKLVFFGIFDKPFLKIAIVSSLGTSIRVVPCSNPCEAKEDIVLLCSLSKATVTPQTGNGHTYTTSRNVPWPHNASTKLPQSQHCLLRMSVPEKNERTQKYILKYASIRTMTTDAFHKILTLSRGRSSPPRDLPPTALRTQRRHLDFVENCHRKHLFWGENSSPLGGLESPPLQCWWRPTFSPLPDQIPTDCQRGVRRKH